MWTLQPLRRGSLGHTQAGGNRMGTGKPTLPRLPFGRAGTLQFCAPEPGRCITSETWHPRAAHLTTKVTLLNLGRLVQRTYGCYGKHASPPSLITTSEGRLCTLLIPSSVPTPYRSSFMDHKVRILLSSLSNLLTLKHERLRRYTTTSTSKAHPVSPSPSPLLHQPFSQTPCLPPETI